jgi:hypothetical protein
MLLKLVSSILAVESRHDAFFRQVQGAVPNPAPFDTGSTYIWDYNRALSFITPGSCPVEVPVPVLPRLTVTQQATAPYMNSTNSTIPYQFTWDPTQMPFIVEEGKDLLVGWVNQMNMPTYTTLTSTGQGQGTSIAPREMNGVAFAVIATQQYNNVNDLASGMLAGPVIVPIS